MADFRLLGQVDMRVADRPVDLGTLKQRAVATALLVDAGRPVRVDTIIERVWGETAPPHARSAVYTHIMRVRRLLGELSPPVRISHGAAGYTIEIDRTDVDWFRLHDLAEKARDPALDDSARLGLLRQAVALWVGQPLADLSGDWVERTRQAWHQQYLDVVVAWARAELTAGDPRRVLSPVRALATENPLAEPLAALVIQALATVGRTAEAMDYYAGFRQRLAEELGTEPGPLVQAIHQALLHCAYDNPAATDLPALRDATDTPTHEPAGEPHRPARRRYRLATVSVLVMWGVALTIAVATGVGPLAAAPSPTVSPSQTHAAAWAARTVAEAPLFDPSGALVRTIPANYTVWVTCRYPGTPPPPWRTNGTEYHVVTPLIGHIPDRYLSLNQAALDSLPHCPPRSPQPASPTSEVRPGG